MNTNTLVQEPLQILLVEDNPGDVELVREYLSSAELGPHELQVAGSLGEACERLLRSRPDVVFLDLRLPDAAGPEVVSRLRDKAGSIPIVVLSGSYRGDEQTAAECLRAGAQGYQSKNGLSAEALLNALWRALAADDSSETQRALEAVASSAHEALEAPGLPEPLRWALSSLAAAVGQAEPVPEESPPEKEPRRKTTRSLRRRGGGDELVTCSAAMGRILETCQRVAPTAARVLILGETGTGKELLARAIHKASGRRGAFVAVNCAAVPPTLVESELFGHERGAFTGAVERKRGLFAQADGGTLLLDEVGELPLAAQASTLRVLQEGTVRPVGGGEELPVDVRVLAATSACLDDAVLEGRFREDLLYRLDVIRIVVPPLRQRREDILPLFHFYLRKLGTAHGLDPPELEPDFTAALREYDWPGNVRQLVNVVERALLTREGRLSAVTLRELIGARPGGASSTPAAPSLELDPSRPLQDYLDEIERRYLESALRATGGSLQATATAAGVSSRTLLRKLKKHGLDRRKFRD